MRQIFNPAGFLMLCVLLLVSASPASAANDSNQDLRAEIEALKERLAELEAKLDAREASSEEQAGDDTEAVESQAEEVAEPEEEKEQGIRVHGAVRTQFSYEDYNSGNEDRVGDFDFDIFRLNFDGSIGDVILSAEYRWFQYQHAIHHAWVGYNFTDTWQGRVGIFRVPFGSLPYNSHSYFFDSTYYVGLEDDYDAGVLGRRRGDKWDLDLAFFKNDEQGGVDGYVDNRSDRYSYDIVGQRLEGEGTFDSPSVQMGESNSFSARVARHFEAGDLTYEIGFSGLFGDLECGASVDAPGAACTGGSSSGGDRHAYALHFVADYDRWNFQLQASDYEYDLKNGGGLMTVGAYSFYDTIPASAKLYTANVAYNLPVDIGPITGLTFYNDFSLMTDKSGGLQDDTLMNVLGVAVSAGGLYTYVDFVTGENQPFIGGSMGQDGGDRNHRLNINFGYYF
ncbi:MAG: carbohydrate porin [Acidobacteriota bacterium]|nr:carbohydrate porin [Acidobacteriota bacterium]